MSAPSVPEWIGGIGSMLAAVTAVAILISEVYRSRSIADAQREQTKRAQAGLVTWWTDNVGPPEAVPREYADAAEAPSESRPISYWDDLPTSRLFIRNGSEDCIYEVSLQLPAGFHPSPEHFRDTPLLWRQVGVLPPGTSEFSVPKSFRGTPTEIARAWHEDRFNLLVDWVEFRDRNGSLWRRFGDGHLEEQPPRAASQGATYTI